MTNPKSLLAWERVEPHNTPAALAVMKVLYRYPVPYMTAPLIRQYLKGGDIRTKNTSQKTVEARLSYLTKYGFVVADMNSLNNFTCYWLTDRGRRVVEMGEDALLIIKVLEATGKPVEDERKVAMAPVKAYYEQKLTMVLRAESDRLLGTLGKLD